MKPHIVSKLLNEIRLARARVALDSSFPRIAVRLFDNKQHNLYIEFWDCDLMANLTYIDSTARSYYEPCITLIPYSYSDTFSSMVEASFTDTVPLIHL